MSQADQQSSDQNRKMSKQNVASQQRLKAEADEGLDKPQQVGSKEQNLVELEGIKTMTWHKKPLVEACDELGYQAAYKKAGAKMISENTEQSDYKSALDGMGTDLYKKFGLPNDEEVLKTQRKNFGSNALTEVDANPWQCILFRQFSNLFALLLEGGCALCFIAYIIDPTKDTSNLYLGIVLGVVVLLTGFFGFYQEFKSNEAMASFKNYVPAKSTVLRSGKQIEIMSEDIVVGDIVVIKQGMRVPADMRVIECSNLQVDNSCLTGESMELERLTDPVEDKALEAKNIMFQGTLVKAGQGRGLVIKVGDHTFMGLIAKVMTDTEVQQTPIAIEIEHFIHIISQIAFGLGISFFIAGAVIGQTIITNLVFMIGIIVANVPEGLLATVTVGLTITATRMADENVLVKNLESVETLGSTSCICSDKTGTLTQNRMTVVGCQVQHKCYATQNKLDTEAQALIDKTFESNDAFQKMIAIGSLCSTANVEPIKIVDKVESKLNFDNVPLTIDWHTYRLLKTSGSATESGIIKYCYPQNTEVMNKLRDKQPCIQKDLSGSTIKLEIPFDSKQKQQASVHKMEDKLFVVCKGAPDRVVDMCAFINNNGQMKPVDNSVKNEIMSANENFASNGRRVLAFSYQEVPLSDEDKFFKEETLTDGSKKWVADIELKGKLVLAGLFALEDPARIEVPPAVKACHSAGVRVIMVTGDHKLTAQAIARDIGILTSDPEKLNENKVMSGDELSDKLASVRADPNVDPKKVEQIVIDWVTEQVERQPQMCFARTSPEQKFIIVAACQQAGYIVAVTGDGVNDSPAMKKADIGIAMGIEGTDVAKDASDMILLDDNFASIVIGIMEGRLIFDNLKKSIAQTLSSNIPEILPFILFIVTMIPLPLSTVLILAIDLGTDMIPAISMAYETAEADLMMRKPRDSKIDRLVTGRLISYSYFQIGVVQAVAAMFVWFTVWNDFGLNPGPLFRKALWYGYKSAYFEMDGDNMIWTEGSSPYNTSRAGCAAQIAGTADITDPFCFNTALTQADLVAAKNYGLQGINQNNSVFTEPTFNKMMDGDMRVYFSNHPDFANMFKKCEYEGHAQCWNLSTLAYAQTSYFVTIVIVQWADLLISKTRYMSIATQGMRNNMMNFGLVFETVLAAIMCQTPFNIALGSRPLPWRHFGFNALPFFFYIFIYDEIRKYQVRQPFQSTGPKAGTGKSWAYQYTQY